MTTPASKTQIRVMTLAKLEVSDSYEVNGQRLEDAGLPRDAMPQGETWRTCAKMSDADLLSKCGWSVKDNFERKLGRNELAIELS